MPKSLKWYVFRIFKSSVIYTTYENMFLENSWSSVCTNEIYKEQQPCFSNISFCPTECRYGNSTSFSIAKNNNGITWLYIMINYADNILPKAVSAQPIIIKYCYKMPQLNAVDFKCLTLLIIIWFSKVTTKPTAREEVYIKTPSHAWAILFKKRANKIVFNSYMVSINNLLLFKYKFEVITFILYKSSFSVQEFQILLFFIHNLNVVIS